MVKGDVLVTDNQDGRARVALVPESVAATFQELMTELHSVALRVSAVRVLPEHVDAITTLYCVTVEEPDCQEPAVVWVMEMEELLQVDEEDSVLDDDPVVEVVLVLLVVEVVLPCLVVELEVDELVLEAEVELVVLVLALAVVLVEVLVELEVEVDEEEDVHPVSALVHTHSAASVHVGEPLLPHATCL